MSDWDIQISLDHDIVEIGGVLSGRVRWERPNDGAGERVRALELIVLYKTEGVGDTDSAEVAVVRLAVPSEGAVDQRFDLTVPVGSPISYDGSLMRVSWKFAVRLDIRLRRDYEHSEPILVVPTNGGGRYRSAHPLRPVLDQ